MKFIALATLAAAASAINLSAETEVATEVASGYDGPIVPENFDYAVHDFDMYSPITDEECYQKQLDIYSDQIIAIEALRLEVLQLTQRITQAEHDYEHNAEAIAANKAKISDNSYEALLTKAKIDVLFLDLGDVAQCLDR